MAIYKEKPGQQYGIIPSEYVKNPELSLKERGLLITLYTLPEAWKFSLEGLTVILKDGLSSVRSTFQKLVQKGYIVQKRKRDPDGRYLGMDLYIRVHAVLPNAPPSDFPQVEKTDADFPIMEKPLLEEHRKSNIQKSNIKEFNKQKYIPARKKNAFNNFHQRKYDHDDLEKRILTRQMQEKDNQVNE